MTDIEKQLTERVTALEQLVRNLLSGLKESAEEEQIKDRRLQCEVSALREEVDVMTRALVAVHDRLNHEPFRRSFWQEFKDGLRGGVAR